jgi:ubiquinone/menaquinone biosynthesis C-methylase UbiE
MLADVASPAELNSSTVLDYGCGTGDFYRFLKRKGINVTYTGVDINKNFIELAMKKYPNCTFRVLESDEDVPEGYYDYIFICGVFNLQVPGVDEDMKNTMVRLFQHCNKALVLDALSSHSPVRDHELHFTSPEEMVKFSIENLSPSVSLRHDRIPNNFTLYVYTAHNEIPLGGDPGIEPTSRTA